MCKFIKGPKESLAISLKKIGRENVQCIEASLGSVAEGTEKAEKKKAWYA